MQSLRKTLAAKLNNAQRIAVLGIGSDLRADDSAGERVVRALQARCKDACGKARFFFGSTAPENLTGEIKRYKPSHIIIIDSAELEKKPGAIQVLSPKEIAGASFSTHRLPTKILVEYLMQSLACKVLVIGIQPKSLVFGKSVSPEVDKAIEELSAAIAEVLAR